MTGLDATSAAVALLYRRAGFGATMEQVAAGVAQGYEATVDELLAGLGAAPDPHGTALVAPPFAPRSPRAGKADPAAAKAQRLVYRHETPAAQDWWMNRLIVTDTPLREKLTLLWSGHFATGISKVADPQLMYNQNQLFRSEGGGPFLGLTQAVAKDPAMMIWLDTFEDNAAHPNENFARELMELFTIGLGNYTQSDVTAAASAFTGYSLDPATRAYLYRPRRHASSPVSFLGHTGDLTGDEIIEILVDQTASARFVVASTWSHLAYPVAPSDPVVDDLLASYRAEQPFSGLLRTVFLHPQFIAPSTQGGLVKQPLEYLAGAARALRLDAAVQRLDTATGLPAPSGSSPKGHRLVALAGALGQIMFDPPSVGGWGQNAYWLNTATALVRWQAARLMAEAADLAVLEPLSPPARLTATAGLLGIGGWGPTSAAALGHVAGNPVDLVTLALNAPEYILA